MSGYHVHRGTCLSVDTDDASRVAAIKCLLRPDEVTSLWHVGRRARVAEPPIQVASWLKFQFNARALAYRADPIYTDRWCSPATTIARGFGDCDDLAILAASLLLAKNVNAWVVIGTVTNGQGRFGHAWVEGNFQDGDPFVLEATSAALFDRRPSSYQARLAVNQEHVMRVARQSEHAQYNAIVAGVAAGIAVGFALSTMAHQAQKPQRARGHRS